MSLKKDGLLLSHENEQTNIKCLKEVRQHILAFRYVKIQTIDICIHVILQKNIDMIKLITIKDKLLDPHYFQIIDKFPEVVNKIFDPNYSLIIEKNPKCIQYIDFNIDNYYNLCCNAISKDINVFELIPIFNLKIYQEICIYSIKKGVEMNLIKNEYQTDKMFLEYIKQEKEISLYKINKELIINNVITQEICDDIINKNHYNLEFIPNPFKTLEICIHCVSKSNHLIEYVRPSIINIDYELIKIYIRYKPYMIDYIKINQIVDISKYYELCNIALISEPDKLFMAINLEYINKEQYFELCKKACNNYKFSFYLINKSILDETQYIELIKIRIKKNKHRINDDIKQNYFKLLFTTIINDSDIICPICDNNKFVFLYTCHESHYICCDCYNKFDGCYYKCEKSDINFDKLYININ